MNVMNNSSGDEEQAECPLCMEPLEVDDLNFYPCTCGYQICRFCWHRIRTDENELCPACRKAYPENPADFTPLSQEQIAAFKAEKRQRDQQRKAKISENRKHLANVRVVQKNLVFVVGLPPRLADPEILRRHEYFGKYGKIHKVVINPSTTYAGGPSASAYVTYINNNDALKAIQSVNNIMIDNRLIKTSLGTTKYCSHFMKNQSCPKPDCMYLHELGDQEASFTKEEMHQGKHQEYEKRLHDTMQAQLGLTAVNGTATNGSNSGSGGVGNGNGGTGTGTTTNGINANGTAGGGGKSGDSKHISDITNGPIQSKDAWPSLSTTPSINGSTHGNGGGGSNKENKINGKTGKENGRGDRKHEKSRSKGGRKHRGGRDADRDRDRDRGEHHNGGGKHSGRGASKDHSSTTAGATGASASASNGRVSSSATAGFGKASAAAIVAGVSAATVVAGVTEPAPALTNGVTGDDKEPPSKVQKSSLPNGACESTNGGTSSTTNTATTTTSSATPAAAATPVKSSAVLDDLDEDDDDELDFEDLDNDALSSDNDGGKTDTPSLSSSGSSHAGGDSGSTLSEESPSGKSSPTSAFPDPLTTAVNNVITTSTTSSSSSSSKSSAEELLAVSAATAAAMTTVPSSSSPPAITNGITSSNFSSLAADDKQQPPQPSEPVISSSSSSLFDNDGTNMTTTTVTTSTANKQQQQSPNGMNKINSLIDSATSRFSKLGFFDDNSSFFSHSTFDPYSFNKLEGNLDGNQSTGLTSSQLPDLLSGTNDTNEQHTKEILKNLGNLQQPQQQHPHQPQQPHHLLNGMHLQQQLNGLGLGNNTNGGGVDGLAGLGTGSTDDWEAAFSKYVMRNKLDAEHHEELLRMQELQKRNLINSGLNTTQFNGFNGDYSDYFHNTNELNSRLLSQQQLQAHQRLQQQHQQADLSHIYAGNMSKFFDFHKNQQQQAAQQQQSQPPPFLQQQQQQHNGHTDPMNIANLLENSRLNSHFLEQHTNGLLGSQLQQKQRMLNGQLNAHSILLNGASPQQQPPPQNNRLHNPQQPQQQQQHQYPQPNPVVDDDLGFDPFFETQKALAELINDEINQQQQQQQNGGGSSNPQQQQQHQQNASSSSSAAAAAALANHKMLENVQRTRMPPPGFNHMNAFGFGVPRAQVSGSKILPFMNLANSAQQQQQQPQQANWGQQLQQQQQQFMGFQQNEQNHLAQSQPQNGHSKAGYGNNFPDWTSFDPAIVSYRQFSFMNGPNQQQQQQQQQPQGDLFLTAQQQQQQQNMQQPGQGFGHHGLNLQSNLMNQQQQPGNPQAQVKYDDFFLHQHQQLQQHQQQQQMQQQQQQQQQQQSNMNDYLSKLSYRMLSS